MEKTVDYYKLAPNGLKNMQAMEAYLSTTTLQKKLMELVKIRVSQINGCAYCINSHAETALKLGETQQRIFLLNAWTETDKFSDAEKVVLELAELLTKISEHDMPRSLYDKVLMHYTEKEYVDLVLLITQINSWNRLALAMGRKIEE